MRSPLLLCIPESDFRAGIKHKQLLLFPESDRSDASSRRWKELDHRSTPHLHHLEDLLRLRHDRHRQLHAVQNKGAGLQQTGASRLSHDSARDHAPCAVMQHVFAPLLLLS